MSVLRARPHGRPIVPVAFQDWLVAALALLGIGALILLTPAFTDYDVETDPAIQAFLAGHVSQGFGLLPAYGASVLMLTPFAWLAHALGGGPLAEFRAVAVPGAVGVAWLAVLAARWQRAAGLSRRDQLTTVAAVVLSPCVALCWSYGHQEDLVIGALAVAAIVVAAGDGRHAALASGLLVGAAAGLKPWAIVLVPVVMAAAGSPRPALRAALAAAGAIAVVSTPQLLAGQQHLTGLASGGTGGIFSVGNLWWFLGSPNPDFAARKASDVVQFFTTANSARTPPAFVEAHARQVIVALSVVLAGAWAWVHRGASRATEAGRRERLASLLLLVTAVIWWRALIDPWFQAYYLLTAVLALLLAGAARGRLPIAGLVVWAMLWILHGPSAIDLGLGPDALSALWLAWLVPAGGYVTMSALRPLRVDALHDRSTISAPPEPLDGEPRQGLRPAG